jgi:pimeloyl-[acyl-carrier protein] methyl ester esterase
LAALRLWAPATMPELTLFLVHGWGFDRSLWEPLRAELAGTAVSLADLGYFGAPDWPAVAGPSVAVGHSLGSLLLLRDPPPDCRALVAINGFDRFTAGADTPGVPSRVVDRMLARFTEALGEFRRRCGDTTVPARMNTDRLKSHLRLLRDGDERERAARWAGPILSLQAGDDPILPAGLREAAFSGAADLRRVERPDGGHLLPVTQPAWCADQIRGLLAELE